MRIGGRDDQSISALAIGFGREPVKPDLAIHEIQRIRQFIGQMQIPESALSRMQFHDQRLVSALHESSAQFLA